MPVKVLVTGAGGFVGSALTRHLLEHGYAVRAMVRNPSHADSLAAIGAEPIVADLNDRSGVMGAAEGVECIFHIAALFRQAGLPPAEFFKVNVEGTRNLLEAAIAHRVKRVIHCSTVGVHGDVQKPPGNEDTPYNPGDVYQESKVEGEKLFLDYVRTGRIAGAVIRPAMIYGPGDTRTLKLFKGIAERKFFYVGKGDSYVHFVDVRDLARAFRLAAESDAVNGETFIVAGSTALPLSELVNIIALLLGVPKPWLHLPVRPMQWLGSLCETVCVPLRLNPPIFRRRVDFFTKNRNFDCTKARRMLRFVPEKSFVEELIDIVNSYVASGQIDSAKIRKPSIIFRDLEGKIQSWDPDAIKSYGYCSSQAVGSCSHTLLSTGFSQNLLQINEVLRSDGIWRGRLTHRTKDGRVVNADSTWRLVQHRVDDSPYVLELNHLDPLPSKRAVND